ncbi:MAG: DNA mismatch repair protein MutS [Butyrivibrio sp.]
MNNTEKTLEFDIIKRKWADLALTEGALKRINEIRPIMWEDELRAALKETTEARTLIEKNGMPPLVSLNGITQLLEAAEKGDCLSPAQLETVENALVAIMRMKSWLDKGKAYDISLAFYEENLFYPEELREEIHLKIRDGAVSDSASGVLKKLRSEIEHTKDRMREKAEAVIKANKECMSDFFSTYRSGRICVPVKKEYKYKISGSVIDRSATGNTLFIEPAASGKLYGELELLKLEEENEVRRILYELTAMAAEYKEALAEDIRVMEKLDFSFSKAKLSLDYDGTEPKINTDRYIVFKAGRHPLMDSQTCVPLEFQIGRGINGIVITGPNTGGKTVAIKTVALNCLMAQCGLHVSCKEADICMNSNILCDIGDGQNISENLSTFSAHIVNVLDILSRINKESLVIMDELGSGTDPAEGMGIAIAVLEELKRSGAFFLVTTHYPEVKQYADKEEKIQNARMTFDKENLKPLYQMVIGEAGESCAFHIAARLGMPEHMLAAARAAAYNTLGENTLELSEISAKKEKSFIHKFVKHTKTSIIAEKFNPGDSVMVYPDKKIGIVCQRADKKGMLRIQMQDKKIWINHKRVKLLVPADKLYPEDYDFSIIFETVENRKLRHRMERKYTEDIIEGDE